MVIYLLVTDKLTQLSRHVNIPLIDPPSGTPVDAPEAGFKVVIIAWWAVSLITRGFSKLIRTR